MFEQSVAVSPLFTFTEGFITCKNLQMMSVHSLFMEGENLHLVQKIQSDPSVAIFEHVHCAATAEKGVITRQGGIHCTP